MALKSPVRTVQSPEEKPKSSLQDRVDLKFQEVFINLICFNQLLMITILIFYTDCGEFQEKANHPFFVG